MNRQGYMSFIVKYNIHVINKHYTNVKFMERINVYTI